MSGKLLPSLATRIIAEEMENFGLSKRHLSIYSSIVQDLVSYISPKEQSK